MDVCREEDEEAGDESRGGAGDDETVTSEVDDVEVEDLITFSLVLRAL